MRDRISAIEIAGLRTVAGMRLELSPFTVLTGENGSGKSTIIEACEIFRALSSPGFVDQFLRIHGGLDALKTTDARAVKLGIEIRGKTDCLRYTVELKDLLGLVIASELLTWTNEGITDVVMERHGRSAIVYSDSGANPTSLTKIPGGQLVLNGMGLRSPNKMVDRTVAALAAIEVHVPFATIPAWVERAAGTSAPTMRVSRHNQQIETVARLGTNLANVFRALRADAAGWPLTMDYIQLGLGEDITDISIRESNQREGLEIFFHYNAFQQEVPARSLSDGTLGYLAYVALARLSPRRSLIAFDEPEVHLHPAMVVRVVQLFESMSEKRPVLAATHSDRFLDAVSDPASSVVICSLDEMRRTQVVRPDKEALLEWLNDYGGYGRLRAAGQERSVMPIFEDGAFGVHNDGTSKSCDDV